MGSHDPSKIVGQLKRARIRKCRIQGTQEQALGAQLTCASRAFVYMRFKNRERLAAEFAVEIRSDLLELTLVIGFFRNAHLRRFLLTAAIPRRTNSLRIASRARNNRFFIVPRGRPVTSAISS